MKDRVTFYVSKGVLSISRPGHEVDWEGLPDGLPVLDLRLAHDEVSAFVLLDPPPGRGRIQCLIRVSSFGVVLWCGELPGREPTDAFVSLETDAEGRVLAATWSGRRVHLNPETGRIEDEVFTK